MTRDSLPDFFSSVAKYLVVRCTHSLSVYSSCRLGRKTAPCFDEQHFECPENLFSRLQAIRKMQWEMACDTNNLVCHQATASRNPGTRELSALAFGHVQKILNIRLKLHRCLSVSNPCHWPHLKALVFWVWDASVTLQEATVVGGASGATEADWQLCCLDVKKVLQANAPICEQAPTHKIYNGINHSPSSCLHTSVGTECR